MAKISHITVGGYLRNGPPSIKLRSTINLLVVICFQWQIWIVSTTIDRDMLTLANCPPAYVSFPCECRLSSIFCYNRNVVHLRPILSRIAQHQPMVNDVTAEATSNQFLMLELDGLPIHNLTDDVLGGLSFEVIALKNMSNLRHIMPNAFDSSSKRLRQLSFEYDTSHYVTETNLQQIGLLLERLPSLVHLYIDAYHLKHIPKHVFAHQTLEDLSFNYNRVKRGQITDIDSEAFYYMPNLRTIDLYEQSIKRLKEKMLTFKNDNNDRPKLGLFLQSNFITSDSIDINLFRTLKRQLVVYIGQNHITYLNQNVFEPFFNQNDNNMIDLGENQLRMDCKNRWITMLDRRYEQVISGTVYIGKDNDSRVLVALEYSDYEPLQCDTTIKL